MPNPNVYVSHITGDVLPAADWDNSFALVESGAMDMGAYIITGLVPSIGTALSVNVTAGTAIIGAHLVFAGFSIVGLADNTVNDLYALQNLGGTSLVHPSVQPANSVKLGQATTAGGVVTVVADGRAVGRQQLIYPQALIPGGPAAGLTSAGHPASINLANWNAAADEGIAVYGVLPPGAGGSGGGSVVTKTANYTLLYTDFVVLADASGGAFTVTLPTAVGHSGQAFVVKKIDATTTAVHLTTTGGQTIDGIPPVIDITTPRQALWMASDGANWFVL